MSSPTSKKISRNQKEENKMIEVNTTWELIPNINQEEYGEFAQKAAGLILKAPGLIEFRASRNILGSPLVRSTSVFKTLADWANFTDSDEWRELEAEFRNFATNIRVEIWGPSPVLPEPVRPG
jgi:heme-degrading monooxygenase HmoA